MILRWVRELVIVGGSSNGIAVLHLESTCFNWLKGQGRVLDAVMERGIQRALDEILTGPKKRGTRKRTNDNPIYYVSFTPPILAGTYCVQYNFSAPSY